MPVLNGDRTIGNHTQVFSELPSAPFHHPISCYPSFRASPNMSEAITDAIGDVSGVLGIVDFFLSSLKGIADGTPEGAVVQIKAGLGDDTSWSLGGDIDAVYAFDSNNNYLRRGEGCGMDDGGY